MAGRLIPFESLFAPQLDSECFFESDDSPCGLNTKKIKPGRLPFSLFQIGCLSVCEVVRLLHADEHAEDQQRWSHVRCSVGLIWAPLEVFLLLKLDRNPSLETVKPSNFIHIMQDFSFTQFGCLGNAGIMAVIQQ